MGYLEGFAVTFAKLFEPRVTGEYKARGEGEKSPKPERLHGRHVLNVGDHRHLVLRWP